MMMYKYVQRRCYSFLSTPIGIIVVIVAIWTLAYEAIRAFSPIIVTSKHTARYAQNIGGVDLETSLSYDPIDVVYTWVNGSDEVWLHEKRRWQFLRNLARTENAVAQTRNNSILSVLKNVTINDSSRKESQDFQYVHLDNKTVASVFGSGAGNSANASIANDSNRYRDSDELKYSIRSLVKNAPWIRRIFILTDNQIPNWLNLEDNSGSISIVTHQGQWNSFNVIKRQRLAYLNRNAAFHIWTKLTDYLVFSILLRTDIFPNKSHLPVFSSPAIEAHLHRIPGLSKKFIYFNDDVFLGSPATPEDFISVSGIQKFHLAWDVPKCAPGCSDSWIGDGFCDRACNVSACNFDFPDCVNATSTGSPGNGINQKDPTPFCAKGCPDSWLGDKVCDARCKNADCAWDMGDCGIGLVVGDFPGVHLTKLNANITNNHDMAGMSKNRFHDRNLSTLTTSNDSFFMNANSSTISLERMASVPVAISVPIGTKAVYFNLTFFQSILYDTASSDFYIASANHTPSDVVHNAVILTRHKLMLVTLYSDQEDAPIVPSLPHRISFGLVIENSVTNTSAKIEFVLQIVQNAAAVFSKMGYPVNMGQVRGYSSSCVLSNPSDDAFLLRKVDIAERPFSISDWGTKERSIDPVVGIGLVLAVRHLSSKIADLPTNHFIVKYKITSNARVFEKSVLLCDAIGSVSSSSYAFRRHYSKEIACPDTIGTLIRQQAVLHTHSYFSAQMDPHSHIPRTYIAGDEVTYLTILVPVPQKWTQTRSQWIQSNVGIVVAKSTSALELLGAIDKNGVFQHKSNTWKRNNARKWSIKANSRNDSKIFRQGGEEVYDTLLCVSASFQWGVAKTKYSNQNYLFANASLGLVNNSDKGLPHSFRRRLEEDTYAQSLIFVNRLYTKKFGPENRKVPAHLPHMIDRDVVQEMQNAWETEWNATSSNKFRSRKDMQYSFSYYYYMLNRHTIQEIDVKKIIHEQVDTDGDGLINDNEFRTLTALAHADIEVLHNCTLNVRRGDVSDFSEKILHNLSYGAAEQSLKFRSWPSVEDVMLCELAVSGIRENFDRKQRFQTHTTVSDKAVAFEMIGDNYTTTLSQLDSIRMRQSKFICINDNMVDPSEKLVNALRNFFVSLWPTPSKFELPHGTRNPFLRYDEYVLWRETYVATDNSNSKSFYEWVWKWFEVISFHIIVIGRRVFFGIRKAFLKVFHRTASFAINKIEILLSEDSGDVMHSRKRQINADIFRFRGGLDDMLILESIIVIGFGAISLIALCFLFFRVRNTRQSH